MGGSDTLRVKKVVRIVFALTVLAGLLCGPGAEPLRAQPPQGQGQLDASPSLFSVLAALNAAGFDTDLDSPTNHPLRAAVRKAIAAKHPPSLARLKSYVMARKKWTATAEISQYISFALSVDGPPDFKPRFTPNQMPPDAAALDGFSSIMAEFHREAGIDELWRQAQPAFDQVIAQYHGPVSQALLDANMYLRNPTSGIRGKRFQIYLDLLGAPNQVHVRSFGDDYFVVVTPSAEPRVNDIRHAYLHYALDPLSIRFAANLDKKKGLGDQAQASPVLDDAYKNDFALLAGMSLVKAVEARMDRRMGQAHVDQAMREGFVLTAYFAEALQGYEKQEQALRLYLPEMIDRIDLKKEDERISKVAFAQQRTLRTVKPVAPAPAPISEVDAQLQRAEEVYARRELPAAREEFRKALAMAAPPPAHAKAYFGLARIATLERDPEAAQQLFEKTLTLDPEPFERGWTHVYLARLALAAQDPEAAEKHYRAALAVHGASEAARKAAQQELARAKVPH